MNLLTNNMNVAYHTIALNNKNCSTTLDMFISVSCIGYITHLGTVPILKTEENQVAGTSDSA